LIFSQDIVFTEEMYKSVINDNAEDCPKVAFDAYPTVVLGSNLSPILWIEVISHRFQILGKIPELRMMLKSLSTADWNSWSIYFIISFRISSTPQAFLCWRVCILSCSSFNVTGESSGLWLPLIADSKICN
jgi:hypothetical protein